MGWRLQGIDSKNSIVLHKIPTYVVGGYFNDNVERNAKRMLLGILSLRYEGNGSSLTGWKHALDISL